LLLYKYISYDYRVIFFMSKCVYIILGHSVFVNCNWVATRWQQFSTHIHTNNTENDIKQTIHRTTQKLERSAGRAPSLWVIP